MAVTQKVTLYNNKFTVPPVINAVQNDTDRQVEAYFGDFTLQVGMTGKLSFIRSDGTHYEVSATLNTGANTATAELDQALTQAGVTQAQLKITDSGNVGSTFTFMIKVQADVAGISQQQDGYSAEELAQGIADNASAIANIENVELPKKADQDGYYEDLTSGTSLSVLGTPTTESVPYLFRRSASIGVRESDKIIGGTVALGQYYKTIDAYTTSGQATGLTVSISNGYIDISGTPSADVGIMPYASGDTYEIPANHVCLITCDGANGFTWSRNGFGNNTTGSATLNKHTANWGVTARIKLTGGTAYNIHARFNAFDLTQMLGSTIADYIYGLESGTAGAGIAKLKEWGFFGKDYYAYDSGSLQSVKTSAHKTVGKNLLPTPYADGNSKTVNGITYTVNADGSIRISGTASGNADFYMLGGSTPSYDDLPVPSQQIWVKLKSDSSIVSGTLQIFLFDSTATSKIGQNMSGESLSAGISLTTESCRLFLRIANGKTVNATIYPMVVVSDDVNRYEPYESHTYPLSPIDLRGIPKLDAQNKLYYDGDEYSSDGSVTRRYRTLRFDGSETWTQSSISQSSTALGLIRLHTAIPQSSTYPNRLNVQTFSSYLPTYSGASWNVDTQCSLRSEISDRYEVAVYTSNFADADAWKTYLTTHPLDVIYELATPTTETADPFHDPQICSPYGTEEYVDTRDVPVPVGHETEYYADPVAEIERVAVQVPVPPTANGTYRLTCVVSGGVPSYSWTS